MVKIKNVKFIYEIFNFITETRSIKKIQRIKGMFNHIYQNQNHILPKYIIVIDGTTI